MAAKLCVRRAFPDFVSKLKLRGRQLVMALAIPTLEGYIHVQQRRLISSISAFCDTGCSLLTESGYGEG